MRQREQVICVRTTDYSETSQVVHFFTRNGGMARLLAKGSKRSKSKTGAIDLLSEGEAVFIVSSRDALGTLVEFSETVAHSSLRASPEKLNAALYMIELVGEMLAEADPHPEVFDLLHNGLARIGQADAPVAAVLAYFQWRLLRHVGLMGEMRKCVSCGQSLGGSAGRSGRSVYFSSTQGGLLCEACHGGAAEKYRADAVALAGLDTLAAAEAGAKVALPEKNAMAANRLLAYHIAQQRGKVMKMARYALGDVGKPT